MKNEVDAFYAQWLEKAEEDAYTAKTMLEDGKYVTPVCFHLQQMAEKYLKGLLAFFHKTFPKTHDLLQLETLLLEIEPSIRELHADLQLLDQFSVETRYPGDYPEFTLTEAKEAYDAALRIKDFVLKKINEKKTGG